MATKHSSFCRCAASSKGINSQTQNTTAPNVPKSIGLPSAILFIRAVQRLIHSMGTVNCDITHDYGVSVRFGTGYFLNYEVAGARDNCIRRSKNIACIQPNPLSLMA
jgi:hypothetical protein